MSTARDHGLIMVKILNKCILSILVYNLFLVRHRNISIHRYVGCLHKIDIQIKKKIQLCDWAKK